RVRGSGFSEGALGGVVAKWKWAITSECQPGAWRALETVHHLYVAQLKGYISTCEYESFRERYLECVRMLNGMGKTLERQLPQTDRRWLSSGDGD
ncbi:MAG: hypothetical protein WBL15_10635, partial [Phycisphaerae bacterium]